MREAHFRLSRVHPDDGAQNERKSQIRVVHRARVPRGCRPNGYKTFFRVLRSRHGSFAMDQQIDRLRSSFAHILRGSDTACALSIRARYSASRALLLRSAPLLLLGLAHDLGMGRHRADEGWTVSMLSTGAQVPMGGNAHLSRSRTVVSVR